MTEKDEYISLLGDDYIDILGHIIDRIDRLLPGVANDTGPNLALRLIDIERRITEQAAEGEALIAGADETAEGDPFARVTERLGAIELFRLPELEVMIERNAKALGWDTDDPGSLGSRIAKIERRLGHIGKKGSLNDRIAVIEKRLDDLNLSSAEAANNRLDELADLMVRRGQFESMIRRIMSLEERADQSEIKEMAIERKLAGAIDDGKEIGKRLTEHISED